MNSDKAQKISGIVCKTLFCVFTVCGLSNAILDNIAMTIFCCTMMIVTAEE